MKKLIYIYLVLISISCNERIKENNGKVATFDFIADVIIKKEDDLILYYRDGSNEWFDDKHAIWVHVKGSNTMQTIKFSLPEGVLPNNLRFDFSKNPNQEPIKINRIKVKFLTSSFEVQEKEINNYFTFNEYVVFDKKKKTYEPIKDSKGIYDPFMLINEGFYNEMDRIIMGN